MWLDKKCLGGGQCLPYDEDVKGMPLFEDFCFKPWTEGQGSVAKLVD